jgi:HEPN domain-containing protein
MSDLEHARALLRMAQADLNALRGMLSANLLAPESYFSDEVFGFHAQQAAEKSLKAWIASLGRRYPRTHDLMSLVENLVDAGEDTTALDRLVDLNPFAVEYRYQSLDSDDDPIDRDAFYQEVQTLFDHVASKISP